MNADLIRSDHDGFFEKVQVGLEGNYFFSRKFAATLGVEGWSDEGVSAVIGTRLYPIDEAFVRLRGLIGRDVSIGGGFAKPIGGNLRIESMADFYFTGNIAIRAGLAYAFRNIDRGKQNAPN